MPKRDRSAMAWFLQSRSSATASHRAEDVLEEAAAFFCVAAAHAGEHVAPLPAEVLLVVLHGGVA